MATQLDNPTAGSPAGRWQRGGSDGSIDQVTTSNSVSPTHSLSLLDNNESGYGEWYGFLNLTGLVSDGDVLDLQWFQIYNITNGNMRLSFAFLDAGNATLGSQDFNVSGQSPGWNGSVASSPFRTAIPAAGGARRNNPVASQLRLRRLFLGDRHMVIDDLSVRLSQPLITGVTVDASGVNLTWNSAPTKTYTVLFASALGAAHDLDAADNRLGFRRPHHIVSGRRQP